MGEAGWTTYTDVKTDLASKGYRDEATKGYKQPWELEESRGRLL